MCRVTIRQQEKRVRIILFTRYPASAVRKYTLNEFKAADYRHRHFSRMSEMIRHVVNTIYRNVSHEINSMLHFKYACSVCLAFSPSENITLNLLYFITIYLELNDHKMV